MSVETTVIIDGKYKVINPTYEWREDRYESIEGKDLDKGTLRFIDGKICILKFCYLIKTRRKFLFSYKNSYKIIWEALDFGKIRNESLRELIETKIDIDKQQEKLLKVKKELEMEKENT